MFDKENKKILADIPLTRHSGKIRIKSRSMFYEYGIPHATRSVPFTQNNYVEWQIGYDLEYKERDGSSLPHISFIAYNGKKKVLYELSEYLYYFYFWGVITSSKLKETLEFLSNLEEENLISNHPDCQITRTHPIEKQINNTTFFEMTLKYPQLVYKFGTYEIIAEITISEKQRAIGIQPMLYLCFPITELQASENLIGRTAQVKETAQFVIDESNCRIVIEMVKVFGMLSPSHHKDILEILKSILM
ncbi:MAG: R.Pab1 family restriction endonuclease [Candidatus Poribacteria bacterium]|nr:R.Pab1 family restriction endonuclease [Candidatus Poribacteria bacterium]